MPRVWRRYLALTPQERAINGWRKLRNTLVSLPALRYQYASPRTACRGGINRPGYRTHQSDHWVYRFSGAGSGDISGVLPSARARTARPGDAALCQGRAVSKPQTIWRPAASLVEYPPAHTKVRRQYSSSQCQMMAPVLIRDPSSFALLERILTSTLHTASPLLYFHLSRSSHHVSTAAPPALTNRQPNLARGVALSSRYARKTTTSLVGNLSLR